MPTSRIHVVTLTVVRRGPTDLWDHFAWVVGIPEGTCDLEVARPNESVDVVTARLLEQVGPRLRAAIDRRRPGTSPTAGCDATSPTSCWCTGRAPIRLRRDAAARDRERSMTSVARLRDAGYDVVGDLDDLTALEPDPEAVPPEDVTDAELLDAAYDLIADLLAQLRATTDSDAPLPGTL